MKQKKQIIKTGCVIHIITVCITILLLISNIIFINKYFEEDKEIVEEVLFTQTTEEFNSKEKYYANIKYDNFRKIYRSSKVSTIAVIDNSSKTYNKFIEMINKMAFYKNTKIYLLEVSKLSRKNEIAFYNTDERLKELETNYIITVSNNKIISITTFSNEDLNKIIEGLGE